MSRTFFTWCTALLLTIGVCQNAEAVLINFEDSLAGSFITNEYISEGIIFDGTWVHGGSTRASPPNWISGEEYTNNNLNPNPITGYFVTPNDPSKNAATNYLSVSAIYVDSDTVTTLDVYDINGTLLASVSRSGSGILSVSQTNIHKFAFYHNNYGYSGIDDIIGFDNVTFNDVTEVTTSVSMIGFFQPVDMNGVMNVAKSGKSIPLKFQLGTDPMPGFEVSITSVGIDCESAETSGTDAIEVYAGGSGLQYLGEGYWQWNWKTPKAYANTCQMLTLTPIADGQTFTPAILQAKFSFK